MSKAQAQIKSIFYVFTQRFFCTKVAVLGFIMLFVQHYYLSPFHGFSKAMDYKMTPYIFPFLMSDIYFQIVFMLGVTYYFSNVPFMQQWGLYQVVRTGKRRWGITQLGSIILSSIGIMLGTFIEGIIILIPSLRFEEGWGKLIHTLSLTDVGRQFALPIGIDYRTISTYTPFEAIGLTFLLGCLVIIFFAFFMFAMSLFISRTVAIGVAMVFITIPIILKNISVPLQLFISRFSPVSWMQLNEIGREKFGYQIMPDLPYVLVFLAIAISCLGILIIWKIKTIDFVWSKEDE